MAGLNAITFITTDMAASCAFWETAGFAVAFGGSDAPFTSLEAGGGTFVNLSGVNLSGMEASTSHRSSGDGSWGRIIIHVESPDEVHAAMAASGYEPHADPRDAPWGERYFHITDPDGNEISFARPL